MTIDKKQPGDTTQATDNAIRSSEKRQKLTVTPEIQQQRLINPHDNFGYDDGLMTSPNHGSDYETTRLGRYDYDNDDPLRKDYPEIAEGNIGDEKGMRNKTAEGSDSENNDSKEQVKPQKLTQKQWQKLKDMAEGILENTDDGKLIESCKSELDKYKQIDNLDADDYVFLDNAYQSIEEYKFNIVLQYMESGLKGS